MNMKVIQYKVVMLGGDINIESEKAEVNFATFGNGECYGLQCNYMSDDERYKEILSHCYRVYEEIKKLNILLTQKD